MTESDDQSPERRGAIQHLEAALATDEMDETDYHVRQALQFLGVEDTT